MAWLNVMMTARLRRRYIETNTASEDAVALIMALGKERVRGAGDRRFELMIVTQI